VNIASNMRTVKKGGRNKGKHVGDVAKSPGRAAGSQQVERSHSAAGVMAVVLEHSPEHKSVLSAMHLDLT
jgi:hypothetical protein